MTGELAALPADLGAPGIAAAYNTPCGGLSELIRGVLDQIVQLASEHDENLGKGAGSEHKRGRAVAGADRR
jgi:hypothetical protein